jgi:hypothetical protein
VTEFSGIWAYSPIDEYLSKVSINDKQPLFQCVNKAGTARSGRAPNRHNAWCLGSHSRTGAERGVSDVTAGALPV